MSDNPLDAFNDPLKVERPEQANIYNQQPKEEEKPPTELESLEVTVVQELIKNVGVIMKYAIDNLHRFVIDDRDKNNIKIVNQEAYDMLKRLAQKRAVDGRVPAPTIEDLCDVVEVFVAQNKLTYKDVDRAIDELDVKLRMIVYAALGAAQGVISEHPEHVAELREEREELMLQMLYNIAETGDVYRLLVIRPFLCRFMTDYTLLKMGIPVDPKPITMERLKAAKPEFGYRRLWDPDFGKPQKRIRQTKTS